MTLKEAAADAHAERVQSERDAAAKRREESLDAFEKNWGEKYGIASHFKPEEPECPARDSLRWVKDIARDGYNATRIDGWLFEIDGIPFVWSKTYHAEGTYVLVTCPDCHCERAVHFHGLSDLGKILKAGRDMFHSCRDVELRDLARAIGNASRQTGLGLEHVVEEAFATQRELMAKVMMR